MVSNMLCTRRCILTGYRYLHNYRRTVWIVYQLDLISRKSRTESVSREGEPDCFFRLVHMPALLMLSLGSIKFEE